ncbi:WD40 repeat-like protein [Histomonas meleagridis]|uniref:WD40 repeat-like protein n=1 Tax=Histomonas meleagridis TaxID=135588 RepID=UPI0035594D03|nr:WD40 repeat-like protein [Histomonas meleagridis]KAH0800179.1 WD40 repeat-like protein [Histomonas meleagridis]
MENKPEQRSLLFDPESPTIKREILAMIVQFLEENDFQSSASILRTEASFSTNSDLDKKIDFDLLKSSLLSQDWAKIDQMINEKSFSGRLVYSLYRHRFIEILLSGDTHSALLFLSSRLRPFRAFEDQPGDFDQLTTILIESASPTCSNPPPELEASLQRTLSTIDSQQSIISTPSSMNGKLPEERLIHLIQQAAASQLMSYPLGRIRSIVNDFEPALLPSYSNKALENGHTGNIKAICFIPGTENLLSGGSNGRIVLWDVTHQSQIGQFIGHKGRVWTIATCPQYAVSGSADGTIKIWDTKTMSIASALGVEGNDIYAVDIDNLGSKVISGGFDRSINLWDVKTGSIISTIKGHKGPVTSLCLDSSGNLAISGGKDLAIHLWDLRDSISVRTIAPVLGEVSSVTADREFTRLLAATKNSTNRIWDLRSSDTAILLKGHKNTSKHFVRARFGSEGRTVVGGSEDGKIYTWDADTGILVEKLDAHKGGALDIIYSKKLQMFASCGEDSVIRLWEEKQMA